MALRVSHSGWGSTWVGVAEGALAAGAIAGSLLAIRRPPDRPARAAFAVLVLQAAAIAAVAVDDRAVLVGAMAVIGLTAGLASVWLCRRLPAHHRRQPPRPGLLGHRARRPRLVPLALPAFGAVAAAGGLAVASCVFGVAMGTLCLGLATRRAVATLR